jgi:4-hydroxythreonine-4-phosphate dehydrogenase
MIGSTKERKSLMLEHTYKKSGIIRIGITQGESTGISPEIIAKTIDVFSEDRTTELHIIADKTVIIEIRNNSKSNLKHIIFEEPRYNDVPDEISKSKELSCVYWASKLCINNEIDAVVTAPVDKHLISEKYPKFSGHTGFLKEILNVENVLMLMITPSLKVGIMTEHLPISKVSSNISKERITSSVKLLHDYLVINKKNPSIGVLSLNPHAGDSGLLGTEELEIIIPAIKELKGININVDGPIPADSAFTSPIKEKYDAFLAMYHDQGMIPVKMKGFDNLVNVTLGLPIIRTSPGHGVAYEAKNTGTASASSMIKAVNQAIDMVLLKRIST